MAVANKTMVAEKLTGCAYTQAASCCMSVQHIGMCSFDYYIVARAKGQEGCEVQ